MTSAKDFVDSVASSISDAPRLHELEEGETVRLKLGYFKSNPKDTEGVTISFHFGDGTSETAKTVSDMVEPQLDKRKFRVPTDRPKYRQTKSWTLGYVEVDQNGEVVDYEIDDQYLKPSKQ